MKTFVVSAEFNRDAATRGAREASAILFITVTLIWFATARCLVSLAGAAVDPAPLWTAVMIAVYTFLKFSDKRTARENDLIVLENDRREEMNLAGQAARLAPAYLAPKKFLKLDPGYNVTALEYNILFVEPYNKLVTEIHK